MSMQETLTALLKAGSTDAGVRVYPVIASQGVTRPYIIYQRITANSENVLSGNAGLVNTRLQIDAYADTYAAVQALAMQIDALMGGWSIQNVSLGVQDLYEPDVKLHRVQADYSVWHS